MTNDVIKQLPKGKPLDFSQPLAPQIEQYILELRPTGFILFDIVHFVQLQPYENQTTKNYVAVDRQHSEFVIYDNVHFREEHYQRYTDSAEAAAYIELLLSQPTVLDYAQQRSIAEKGVIFGDDVIIHRNDKPSVLGKIIGYREAFPEEADKLSDSFHTNLFYRPYKKDKTLSSVKPRIIYGDYDIEKVNH